MAEGTKPGSMSEFRFHESGCVSVPAVGLLPVSQREGTICAALRAAIPPTEIPSAVANMPAFITDDGVVVVVMKFRCRI